MQKWLWNDIEHYCQFIIILDFMELLQFVIPVEFSSEELLRQNKPSNVQMDQSLLPVSLSECPGITASKLRLI